MTRWPRPAALALAALLCTSAAPARADEIDDFRAAQQAFEARNFPLAVQRFEALVGGDTPALRSRPLLLESRKYLAAAYLFVGRRAAAERQFELLLRDDPTYILDPETFGEEILQVFSAVSERIARERAEQDQARLRAEAEARRREEERRRRARESLAELTRRAELETVVDTNSRWIALLPFGVGQFQNGHDAVGTVFAVSESVLVVLSVLTYLLHESIRADVTPLPVGEPEPPERRDARIASTALRISNWVSTALLGAVAVSGIVDAQVRFVPAETTTTRRPLPRELRDGLELSWSPTGAALSF